jgi:hypothetical protein
VSRDSWFYVLVDAHARCRIVGDEKGDDFSIWPYTISVQDMVDLRGWVLSDSSPVDALELECLLPNTLTPATVPFDSFPFSSLHHSFYKLVLILK